MGDEREGDCPHCGEAGETDYNDDERSCWYQCNRCGMQGPREALPGACDDPAEDDDATEAAFARALAAWNRLSAMRQERDRLLSLHVSEGAAKTHDGRPLWDILIPDGGTAFGWAWHQDFESRDEAVAAFWEAVGSTKGGAS
jgi:hypothetical protein